MSGTATKGRYAGWNPPDEPAWIADVNPIMPPDLMTPDSKCPHRGRIKPGSLDCCLVCHEFGRDDSPALVIDPREMPKPEPKPPVEEEPEPTRAEKAGRKTSGKMARRRAKRKAA